MSLPSRCALTQPNSVRSTTSGVLATAAIVCSPWTSLTTSYLNLSVWHALGVLVICALLARIESLSKGHGFQKQGHWPSKFQGRTCKPRSFCSGRLVSLIRLGHGRVLGNDQSPLSSAVMPGWTAACALRTRSRAMLADLCAALPGQSTSCGTWLASSLSDRARAWLS